MAPPPRLSNCFVPPVEEDSSNINKNLCYDEEDNVHIETNILPSAAGSALVAHGPCRVLSSVLGPTTQVQHQNIPLTDDKGTLVVEVKYLLLPPATAPRSSDVATTTKEVNSQSQPKNQQREYRDAIAQREQQLGRQVLAALQPIVPLQLFPKSALIVRVDVWNDHPQDSNNNQSSRILTTALLAAVTALATTPGMELYHLVTACTVVERETSGAVTMALLVPAQTVCVWEQQGAVTAQALQACREGCQRWHRVLRKYLIERKGEEALNN